MSGRDARSWSPGPGAARGAMAPCRGAARLLAALGLCLVALASSAFAQVRAVGPIGVTVSDMDRAVDFYSRVLTFRAVSDLEVSGEPYEHLQGVFGRACGSCACSSARSRSS